MSWDIAGISVLSDREIIDEEVSETVTINMIIDVFDDLNIAELMLVHSNMIFI